MLLEMKILLLCYPRLAAVSLCGSEPRRLQQDDYLCTPNGFSSPHLGLIILQTADMLELCV